MSVLISPERTFALTAPFTARSSPRLIVVLTAMKSFTPVSVLTVSRGIQSTHVINSLWANSYLRLSVNTERAQLVQVALTRPS